MKIRLSDHFTYKLLLRFTLPSIAMMIFTSLYCIVDGYFVSNFTGKTAFSAVNFAIPFIFIPSSFGFMFGTGGCALIGMLFGQKKNRTARSVFSMLVYLSIALGMIFAIVGFIFIRTVAAWLGAEGEMLRLAVLYGRICFAALPFLMLQMEFQSFLILAEKPKLGLAVTLISGCTNMLLDWLLVGIFPWGVTGAAIATGASQVVGAMLPLAYFAKRNSSLLQLGKAKFNLRLLWSTCLNGSSEMLSNISVSLISILYNVQLLKYIGEDGVAAYGVLMYLGFVFVSIFIGYSIGASPVISYHFGAENHIELKSLLKKSLRIICYTSIAMFICGEVLALPLAHLFTGYDNELLVLTRRAFVIFSFSFIFTGIPIFGSAFFTALNDGITSSIISGMRTMVFQLAAVLLMPLVLGVNGIWMSLIVSELLATGITALLLVLKKNKFHYV